MIHKGGFLTASEAAETLGTSIKALRLYERRGLLTPVRTQAGWRAFGPAEMERAAQIAKLRALGFSLAQISTLFRGQSTSGLEQIIAQHQNFLEGQLSELRHRIELVRDVRDQIGRGQPPSLERLCQLSGSDIQPIAAFNLPWPWGGELFQLHEPRQLTYIVGPLFSGKTRLARLIAETLPSAVFIGIDRLEDGGAAALAKLETDAALKDRVEQALAWLVDDGAKPSPALTTLLVELEMPGADYLVVDVVEQGLDGVTQEALGAYLRRRRAHGPTLFLLTRSSSILDLALVGPHESVLLCPANHSTPIYVTPCAGAPGYETVASCLAPPEVRARTAGVVAVMPPAA
ncbi:MAG: MerR family transcriptional regulator [Alphaproteobacteria bacterium]|nr:MerR family transcriptional regulator [Alphaproteobacteria bacterium]